MARVSIELDEEIMQRLQKRAESNGRSLDAELQLIVQRGAAFDPVDFKTTAERIRKKLSGRQHSDSAVLIREDRER